MTVLLGPPPSYIRLDLDTHGPVLAVQAPGTVEPPDLLEVLVQADEDLGDLVATFIAQDGTETRLGVVLGGAQAYLAMPTVGMGSGRGVLRLLARDRTCNTSVVEVPVFIDRARPFDLEADTIGVFDMTTSPDSPFETTTEVGRTFEMEPRIDGAFETSTETAHDLDLITEATDG